MLASRAPRPWALIVALAAAATLAGCGGGDKPQQVLSVAQGRGQLVVLEADDRPLLARLEGAAVDGGQLDTDQFAGKALVINIWGAWCAPCKEEQPHLQRAAEALEPAGVQFVGIDVRDSRPAAQAHNRRFGVTYPSFFDPGSRLVAELPIPLRAVPSTLLVDRQRRVVAVIHGSVDEEGLVDAVRRLLV